MFPLALRCQTTWTEDRATQRCDPSAVPGAETGAEAKPQLRLAPLLHRSGIGTKAINLRGMDATKLFAGCASALRNSRGPEFQFTANQYRGAQDIKTLAEIDPREKCVTDTGR